MTVDVLIFTDSTSLAFTRYAGAYTIASVIRKHGYSVQVVDHFLLAGLDKTLSILEKFVGPNTLMVGFSTTFMNASMDHITESLENRNMFRFSNIQHSIGGAAGIHGFTKGLPISYEEVDAIRAKVKSINPNTKLVMGGTKADFTEQPQMDAFILGYADSSIIEFLKFTKGKNPFLQYRVINDSQMVIDYDIDAANYDFTNSTIDFDDTDFIRPNEVLTIEPSRGCVFKCKFCSFRLIGKKKNDYLKNKEVIYSELMRNYEKFGTTQYIFADDTFNESVQKLEHFAEVTARLPFKIEYGTYIRHDLIHRFPAMADLLAESGLKSCTIGIETLNYEAGKLVGKGLHPEKTKEVLHWLRYDKKWKNNITVNSGFIIGLPKENYETVSKWAEELMDFNYPLDSFRIHALGINPNAARLSRSEFEKNYTEYGYYFDKSKSSSWINEHWRQEDASALADTLQRYAEASGRVKVHGFRPMMLQNFGYTWDDIHNRSMFEFDRVVFFETIKMAEEYHNNLLKGNHDS